MIFPRSVSFRSFRGQEHGRASRERPAAVQQELRPPEYRSASRVSAPSPNTSGGPRAPWSTYHILGGRRGHTPYRPNQRARNRRSRWGRNTDLRSRSIANGPRSVRCTRRDEGAAWSCPKDHRIGRLRTSRTTLWRIIVAGGACAAVQSRLSSLAVGRRFCGLIKGALTMSTIAKTQSSRPRIPFSLCWPRAFSSADRRLRRSRDRACGLSQSVPVRVSCRRNGDTCLR